MQHDQKPGRVRVLDAGSETPRRRRHDVGPTIIDATPRKPRGAGRRAGRLSGVALFILGSALGGFGVVWFGLGPA